jgi:hypothetical protein
MSTDTIVAEVRHARETLAQRSNYDLRAMIQDARERQAAGGGRAASGILSAQACQEADFHTAVEPGDTAD